MAANTQCYKVGGMPELTNPALGVAYAAIRHGFVHWGKKVMHPHLLAAVGLLALAMPFAAKAQPVDLPIPAATTSEYPPGVSVKQTKAGPVYVDAKGRTLYGMDMRVLIRWAPDPSKYCKEACAETWAPLLAPASPTRTLLIGAAIIIASGIYIVWDERRLAELAYTPAAPPP